MVPLFIYTGPSLTGVETTWEKNWANFKTTLGLQMTPLGGFRVTSLPEVANHHLQSYVKCALGHEKSKICHLIFTKNTARHFYFGFLFKEKPQIAESVSVESFFNHLYILRHIWPSKSILKLPTDFLGIMSFRVDDRRNKHSAGLRHCLAIPKEMPLWSPQGNP